MIRDMTKLQKKIMKLTKGYSIMEIIHAFEVIKLELLIK